VISKVKLILNVMLLPEVINNIKEKLNKLI
jgi:hypothetical protein